MGDVLDVIDHRAKRRNLGWSQGAELVAIEEIPMKWYLRGEFDAAAVEEAEKIAENAVITAPMTEIQAKAAAEKLGAAVMLRVL